MSIVIYAIVYKQIIVGFAGWSKKKPFSIQLFKTTTYNIINNMWNCESAVQYIA